MRVNSISVAALSTLLVSLVHAGDALTKRSTATVAPTCSLECLGTLIPQYCDSLTDVTCICTSTTLAAVLLPCAVAACNVTDSLQLERYQAEVCETPNDMTRYWQQIHTYFVLIPLVTIFVALRIFTRQRIDIGLGPDDWALLVALAFYLSMTSTAWTIASTGFGEHTFWLSIEQVTKSLKFFYISELLYLCTLTFTKISLLLFYRRIFPSRGFKLATTCAGVFIVASNISLFMALAFQCMPVYGNWTNWMYKVPPVQCINVFAAVYAAAGLSISHDLIILCMPVSTLIGLNLNLRKKANLMVMFGVGSFVIVASAIRLPSLMKMGTSSDPSFDQAPVAFWTNVETSVGIICACLPACRSLIGFYFPRLSMTLNNTSTGNKRKTPGYSHQLSNTNEYFSKKKRPIRDSFIELGDRSGTESQEDFKSKVVTGKRSVDNDSIFHSPQNSTHEHLTPSDGKYGLAATVAVAKKNVVTGLTGGIQPGLGGRDIIMTRTIEQSSTSY